MKTLHKLLLIVAFIGFLQSADGAKETSVGILKAPQINSSNGLNTKDQYYDYMVANPSGSATPWTQQFCIKGSKGIVSLEIDSDGDYLGNTWWVKVPYSVTFYNAGGTVAATESGTLEVRYDQGSKITDLKDYVVYEPVSGASNQFLRAVVGIGSVTKSSNLASIPSNVLLKMELEVERQYTLGSSSPVVTVSNYSTLTATNYGLGYTGSLDYLLLNWSYLQGAEYYDLEYLFVDIGSKDETDAFDYDFRNATRVNLSENRYKLPLAYPKGWILYRVRGVGYDCNGNHTYGTWSSYSSGSATGVLRTSATNFPLVPSGTGQAQIVGWHGTEGALNWLHQTQFGEGAKRNSSLTFFDGSNRSRQSLLELSTSSRLIASQTLYDFQGRPAVDVLPVPIDHNGLKYYGPLNYYSSGTPFGRNHFDLNLGYPAMNSTYGNGAAKYYSPSNPDATDPTLANLPNAEGYPYIQKRFLNDGTNRLKAKSSPGPNHKINSNHELRVMYGTPGSQNELDRLFGNNVGYAEYYTKEIITDANGVGAVVYKDMAGRVIATGLAGGSNPNLSDVDFAPAADAISANMLNNTLSLNQELITKKKFLISSNRTDTYTYTFPAISFSPSGSTNPCLSGFTSKPVKFDLSIQIYDEDGQPIGLGGNFANGVELTNLTSGQYNSASISFSGGFSPGTYTLVKKLSINQAAAESYRNQVKAHIINNAASCGLVDPVSQADCSCSSLCAQAVIYDQGWRIAGLDGTFPSMNDAIAACEELCENPLEEDGPRDECDMLREAMLLDVSPDGQYFDNLPYKFTRNSNGVLEENNPGQNGYNPDEWLETLPFETLVFIGGNNSTVDVSLENIRSLWEDSFAETLLPYHPEYCALQFYCDQVCLDPPSPMDLDGKDYNYIMLHQTVYNPLNLNQVTSTADPSQYQPHPKRSGSGFTLYGTNPELDHALIIGCGGNSTIASDVEEYLRNYLDFGSGNIHSIWYFLEDPDDIALGGLSVPQEIEDLYVRFHGNGSSVVGLFNDGTMDKYDVFRSAYLFYRDLGFYAEFKGNCSGLPFENGDEVPGLEPDVYGDEFHEYKIRFPRKPIMDAYLDNGVEGLQMLAYDAYNSASPPEVSPYDKECVCTQVNTFLIQNGYIAPGESIADLTVTSSIATELSQRFGMTITVSNISAWKSECSSSGVGEGIKPLLKDQNFPVAWLCGTIGSKDCSCAQLLNLINSALEEPVSTLEEVNIDEALVAHLQVEFGDNSITEGDIAAWIDNCIQENGSLLSAVNMVYSNNYPPTLFCYSEASKTCTCDEIVSFAIAHNALSESDGGGGMLQDADPSMIVDALQMEGYNDITETDVLTWADACSDNNTYSLNELIIYHKLPHLFVCLDSEVSDLDPGSNDICDAVQAQNLLKWQEEVNRLADSLADVYLALYYQYAISNVNETFTDSYSLNEYHYTLFYYDQAGNLVSTVPPLGVQILDQSQQNAANAFRKNGTGSFVHPTHTYKTFYNYNSLGNLTWQKSPDAGETYYWYDNLGRVILSQNDEQALSNQYSYSIYDALGRVSESGQIDKSGYTFSGTGTVYEQLYEICATPATFQSFIASGNRDQITFNYYDNVISSYISLNFGGSGPRFLKNRVASSLYIPGPISGAPYAHNPVSGTLNNYLNGYHNAIHYSYDIHGNVETVLRDIVELSRNGGRLFRIDYEYDILTGNVNQVAYQPGLWDCFYQRYFYDAENKLTEVQSSRDGEIWDNDAKYFYYPHGPISRTEIGGEQKVQGQDYAYTIMSWLKGVNSDVLDENRDMGKDGNENISSNLNKRFGQDAMGYSLHFFNNDGLAAKDYKSVGSTNFLLGLNQSNYSTLGKPLYNGNISRVNTALKDNNENEIPVNGMAYYYDQLNRLKRGRSFLGNPDQLRADGDFSSTSPSAKYKTLFTYDFNGNIKELDRFDESGTQMDDLTYTYDVGNEKNQLLRVQDLAGFHNKGDLSTQAANNYDYNEIGNLIRDDAENITNIEWTVDGKIKAIQYSSTKPDLEFQYDPQGNRIMKILKTKTGTTINNANYWEYYHYINDAAGNPLAIYKESFINGSCLSSKLEIEDMPIYGSSRMGTFSKPGVKRQNNFTASYTSGGYFTNVDPNPSGGCSNVFWSFIGNYTVTPGTQTLGNKNYELKNHLGNVLSTVSDRKFWSPVEVQSEWLSEDYEEDPRTWDPLRNAWWEVMDGKMLLDFREPEDGITRVLEGLNEGCTYEICFDLSSYEEQYPELVIMINDEEYPLSIGETNCFTISETSEVNLQILLMGEGGHVWLDNFTVHSTCWEYRLITDVLSTNDYYPFGMMMPGRKYGNGDYRYGFVGMETDPELKGMGNSYDFGARIYDPRIARFLSVDPLYSNSRNFSLSPYHYGLNSPLTVVDEEGELWNIVAGLAAGIVTAAITAAILDRDDPMYWEKVTAAGVGTAVGVATFGAAAPAALTALGGASAIGSASATMVVGGIGIATTIEGAIVSQVMLVEMGAQESIDGNQVLIEGAFSIPGALLGGAGSKVTSKLVKPAFSKMNDKIVKKTAREAWQTYKDARRELAKRIKKDLGVSRKQADIIADDIARKAQESVNAEAQFRIRLRDEVVETTISTSAQAPVMVVTSAVSSDAGTGENTNTESENDEEDALQGDPLNEVQFEIREYEKR